LTIRIRHAAASDAPGIRRVFEAAFGARLSEEEWRWKFELNPDGWFGVVAEDAGEIVGNYAGWGMRFRLEGEDSLLYAVGDVATVPRARGLGRHVFREMTESFYDEVGRRGVPFCFGFPGDRHLAISHRIVGSRSLFPIREVRVAVSLFPPPPARWRAADSAGEEFDALWEASRDTIPCGAVRDRSRANWRFHARPSRYYRMVWVETERGEMESWAVLSIAGERALVVDLLLGGRPGPAVTGGIFSAAAAESRRLGARELVFWETPGGPAREGVAALQGERRDAGFPIIVRVFDEEVAAHFARDLHLTPALYDLV
jgi:hypothetical protein